MSRPAVPARIALCVVVAVASASVLTCMGRANPAHVTDFDQTWRAAQLTLAGQDPYSVIGDGSDPRWRFRYFYPAPATIAAMPLAPLSLEVARAVFVAIAGACFAWAVTRHRWLPAIAFLTQAYLSSVLLAQWTPLLGAAVALPWLGWVFAAKPNVGAIALAAFDDWRAAAKAATAAVAIASISFAIDPGWVSRWRGALATSEHFRPFVMRPGGAILLLVLLRWRRPDARLLAALALIPYTPATRETLLFFLTPLTGPALAVVFVGPHLVARVMDNWNWNRSFVEYTNTTAHWLLVLVYLPLAAAILASPNVGRAPAWAERAAQRLPAWLRGRPA
jgi:hypothetical protein